jgi:hypothetical protein
MIGTSMVVRMEPIPLAVLQRVRIELLTAHRTTVVPRMGFTLCTVAYCAHKTTAKKKANSKK